MIIPPGIKIKENSILARIAAGQLKSKNAAIVFRKTIHLFGVGKAEFLANEKWVKHELKHVEQYSQYGFFRFIFLYLQETIRNGYFNNRFEAEAREAENNY